MPDNIILFIPLSEELLSNPSMIENPLLDDNTNTCIKPSNPANNTYCDYNTITETLNPIEPISKSSITVKTPSL